MLQILAQFIFAKMCVCKKERIQEKFIIEKNMDITDSCTTGFPQVTDYGHPMKA